MSFQQEINRLVAATPTWPLLGTALDNLEKQGASKEEIKEGMRSWGRKQLSQRLLNTASMVITNATFGNPTQFKKIEYEYAYGAAYHTMFSLLDHFSDLCFEAGWPPYGCLVVLENGSTPSGFFSWYKKRNPSQSALSDSAIESMCKHSCATVHPPRGWEVSLKVMEYIVKHRL